MLPKIDNPVLQSNWSFSELPTRTFKLQLDSKRVIGQTDSLEAMKQVIYLILNIERYDYLIYSWNYGIELSDLFGQPSTYVIPEVKRRITEALTQDSRITDVDSFEFEVKKGIVSCRFTVHTIFGSISAEKGVNI